MRSGFISLFTLLCVVCVLGCVAQDKVASSKGNPSPQSAANSSFEKLAREADAVRDADKLEDAKTLYVKALNLRPNWAEGWWSLGTIEYDLNEYPEASRAFQKVTALAPKNGNAYVMLGLSEFELGRDQLSLQLLQKGMRLGLNENVNLRFVALYHQGALLQRGGKFQAAQETLEQLCLQGVQSAELVRTLGMVLLRIPGQHVPTEGSSDSELIARVGHAGCLAGQKKFDESREELKAVVAEHPKYPHIHYAFGVILLEANDLSAADEEFKEEIKNNPNDLVSRLQIAAAMYKTNSAQGLPYAQEAVKLAPAQPFGHYLLGLLLLDTDDYQRAIPELEVAQKAYPREAKIYFALGTAYSRAGRKQEAAQARAKFTRLTAAEKKSASADKPLSPFPNSDQFESPALVNPY